MCRRVLPLALFALCAAGCSAGPGLLGPSCAGPHRQLEAAKALRAEAARPLALPRELDKHPAPPYTVEPGDVLLIQPADFDSPVRLPGDQPVMPDGTFHLGRYGRLQVAGRTVEEIEADAGALIQSQTKNAGPVTVRVVTRQSKVFYVLGEVNAPGAFTYNGRETVLDAILAAGGLTERAAVGRITLSRPTPPDSCRLVLPICYSEIVQLGDTTTNYQLLPGDRVYVPSRTTHEEFWPGQKKPCPPCGRPQSSCVSGCTN